MKNVFRILTACVLSLAGLAFAKTELELKLSLNDLADGETKKIGEGDHAITMTRKGDELTINVSGGDEGEAAGKDGKKEEMQAHVFVLKTDDKSDKGEGDAKEGEAKEIKKEIKIVVKHDGSEASGDDPFAGRVVYQCEDAETSVFITKKQAQEAAPNCPIDGKPMKKVEGKMAILNLLVGDEEQH